MKHRKRPATNSVPDIVQRFELMLQSDAVPFLEQSDFESIIEYYEKEQLFVEANKSIDLAIERFPYQVGFLLSKSSILLAQGKIEDAEKLIDRAETFAPKEWEVGFRRAEVMAMRAQFHESIALLDKLIDEHKEADFGMLYLLKGMVYQELADFRSMFNSLKLSLEADPTNDTALHLFWLSVEICQEHEESIEFHLWLIDQEPYSALAWSNLGHAYSCLKNWPKAAEAFEYAYIIDKEFEFAYRDCAIALTNMKEYKRALECLEEAAQYFNPDKEVLQQIGTCHIELGNFEEARIALLDALSLDANSNQIHFLLGRLHLRQGNFHKALMYIKRALQFDNPTYEYFLELARIYSMISEPEQADHYYDEACIHAPDNLDLHLEFADFKGKNFGEKEALNFLKSVKNNFPDSAINYCAIGIMLNLKSRKKGLSNLANALNKDFNEHTTLLKYFPKLEEDEEVNAIIASYRPLA